MQDRQSGVPDGRRKPSTRTLCGNGNRNGNGNGNSKQYGTARHGTGPAPPHAQTTPQRPRQLHNVEKPGWHRPRPAGHVPAVAVHRQWRSAWTPVAARGEEAACGGVCAGSCSGCVGVGVCAGVVLGCFPGLIVCGCCSYGCPVRLRNAQCGGGCSGICAVRITIAETAVASVRCFEERGEGTLQGVSCPCGCLLHYTQRSIVCLRGVPPLLCLRYCASAIVPPLLCLPYCASRIVPPVLCLPYCALDKNYV